jgi:lysylphosphatidylglycerol synthetase-like protein (DUF2156 family)
MVSNTSVPYEYNDGCPIRGRTCLPFTSTCIHFFSFLCVLFLFVCLRILSCVPNVVHSWLLPICFLCFVFVLFVSVLWPVYSMLSFHDCCRFCFLCLVFILSWMNNIEYSRHNTETKEIKIKQRKQNRQQSWMDNTENTRHNTKTNKKKTPQYGKKR